jgi:catechol 2,3-dioxygenase-like lactoylglutathione lyase family enzyme
MSRISHVEIYVADLPRSREFWSWLFARMGGWQPYQEFQDGFSFRHDDGSYLVFVQTPPAHLAAGYHRQRTGLNHIAFTAPDRAAVDDLKHHLRKSGYTVLYPERHPDPVSDSYAVYFEDPDRIKVEYAHR